MSAVAHDSSDPRSEGRLHAALPSSDLRPEGRPAPGPSNLVPANVPLRIAPFEDPAIRYVRVEALGEEPVPEKGVVDIAVLDMNHRFANLGHSSVVETLMTMARDLRAAIGASAPEVRVISFDVRAGGAVPVRLVNRYGVVVGTGGPGALDPRLNDGVFEGSQGITENPAWELPLFKLFDRILADKDMSFLGICHSFGLLSRWSGVASPVLRPAAKGGKSAGVVSNFLTTTATTHPWFSGLSKACGGDKIAVLDSRLYDMIPTGRNGFDTLAFEAGVSGRGPGEALTMYELARDKDGVLPRIWGVNSHPEIGDRGLQRDRLARLSARGEVSEAWIAERTAALDAWNTPAGTEAHLQIAASFTFEEPVRRRLDRILKDRS